MKKVSLLVFVLMISIAFVSTAFAQAKPAAPAPKAEKPAAAPEKAPAKAEKPAAAPEKPAEPEKPAAPEKPKPKPKPKGVFIGDVTAVNAAAKTFSVTEKVGTPGEKGSVTFDLTNAKFKGYKSAADIKVGDKVGVKYTKDGISVNKIASAKPAKEKKEKKEKAGKKKGFKDVDANKDGKITLEELVIVFVNITPEQFKAFDKNSDGALDEKEYKEALKQMK